MCDPATTIATISVVAGLTQAGLGIASASAAQQQREIEFQFAEDEGRRRNAVEQLQVDIAREREDRLQQQQEDRIRDTIELAQAARANDLDAISLRQKQEMEKASQEKTEKAKAAMRAAGEYRAQGRIGNSSSALLADVQRQLATFDYYTDRNTAFAGQLFDKKRKDADITMANRISSETPYLKRSILDPMAPGKRAAPGKEAMYLQMGSAVMGGITTGLGIDQSLKGMGAFGFKTTG